MPDTKKRYFHALDAIRFGAAMLVTVFHLTYWSGIHGSTPGLVLRGAASYPELAPFAWASWVGVEIFFVLSGFVIANSAYGRTAGAFLKGRFLRLYPAVWVCAPLSAAVWLIVGGSGIPDQARRLLQTSLLAPLQLMPWGWVDGVYWTLMYEIAFYLAAVLVLCSRGRATLVHLASFMSVASGAYIALLVLVHFGFLSASVAEPFARYPYLLLTFLQLRHGGLFATGILFWFMSNGQMTRWRYLTLGVALVGSLGEVYLRAWEFASITPAFPGRHIHTSMLIFSVAVAIIALAALWPRMDELVGLKVAHALRIMGLATYPLYLLHDVVGAFILRIVANIGTNRWVALSITIAAIFSLSFGVCRIAEPWIRIKMESLISRTPLRQSSTSA